MINNIISKLQQSQLDAEAIKTLLEPLNEFDFKQIDNSELQALANSLYFILESYPNKAFEIDDPFGFPLPVSINYQNLHFLIFRYLLNLIPYLDKNFLIKLYQYSLRAFNDNTQKSAIDASVKEIAVEAMMMIADYANEFKQPLFEIFRYKVMQGKNYWNELVKIAMYFISSEQRYSLISEWISLLDTHGESRNWQKSIVFGISELCNNLPTEEQALILNKLLAPLMRHKNYYVRQALVEILNKIRGHSEKVEQLLESLLHDSDHEVVRFVHNTTYYNTHYKAESIPDSAQKKRKEPDPVEHVRANRKKKKSEKIVVNKDEKELIIFKKQLPPRSFKESLIKGLENKNSKIAKYCLEVLTDKYIKRGSQADKLKFMNIFFGLIRSSKIHISEDVLDSYIYWSLSKEDDLIPELAQHLLLCVESDLSSYKREWINLIITLPYKSVPDHIIDKLLSQCDAIINNKTANKSLRDSLLSIVIKMSYKEQHLVKAFSILIRVFNGDCGHELIDSAAEFLANELPIHDIVSVPLIKIFDILDVNSRNQEIIQKTLCFLISVISKYGASPLGISAIQVILNMVNRASHYELFLFIKETIEHYDLSNLEVLNEVSKVIENRLKQTPDNNYSKKITLAWQFYHKEQYTKSLKQINNIINDHYFRGRKAPLILMYLKALNFYKLNQFDKALDWVNRYLQKQCQSILATYLKATMLTLQGEIGQAIDFYKQALTFNPFYIQALIGLYHIFFKSGNYLEADKWLAQIKAINPRFTPLKISLENVQQAKIVVPLKSMIDQLGMELEALIAYCLKAIKDDSDLDKTTTIKNLFLTFYLSLESVFGRQIVSSFQPIHDIPWNKLAAYPNQIARTFRDILRGLIESNMPAIYHNAYIIHENTIQQQTNLEQQVIDTNVGNYVQCELLPFLQQNAHVLTIYDFINKYAFTNKVKDGYALGLSGDISSAYNIFVSIFQLKHWMISYDELAVEPSGSTEHTHQFLEKVIQQNKPIIMFVPVIVENKNGHNITLDEIKYLLSYLAQQGRLNNLYFVFDAYNYLPLFALQKSIFVTEEKSPALSLTPVINYLSNHVISEATHSNGISTTIKEHMLMTRIKINLLSNVVEPQDLYHQYANIIKEIFDNKYTFTNILVQLIDGFNVPIKNSSTIDNKLVFLKLLDAILFHEMPWFGSLFQPSQNDLSIFKRLERYIEESRVSYDTYLNTSNNNTVFDYNDFSKTLSDFQKNLSNLYTEVEKGIHWLGIINAAHKDRDSSIGDTGKGLNESLMDLDDMPTDTTIGMQQSTAQYNANSSWLSKFGIFNSQILTSGINSNPAEWYSDQVINELLPHYLQGYQPQIVLLVALLGTQWQGSNSLHDQLAQYNIQRASAIARGEIVSDIIYIPVNLGNYHWALVIIHYSQDLAALPDIYYLDPLGNDIHPEVKQALQAADIFPKVVVITQPGWILQKDSDNCGPWIIEIARYFAEHGCLPELDKIDITIVRKKQQEDLKLIREAQQTANLLLLQFNSMSL